MLKVLLLTILTLNSSFAADYETQFEKFSVSQHTRNGSEIYYNCDSVEDTVEEVLQEMGAIVRSVRCSGGLDSHGNFHRAAFIRATFDALSSETNNENYEASVQSITLKKRNNCHLYNSIIKGLSPSFEIDSVKYSRCHRPNMRTKVQLNLLKLN